jgi:hypothetical protein
MNMEECIYCGIRALTKNGICSTCLSITGTTENMPTQPAADTTANTNVHSSPNTGSQNSRNTNHTYNAPRTPVMLECWRCKAVNDWEQSKICYQCGCALKRHKSEEVKTLKGDSFIGSTAFRSLIYSALAIVLIVIGISFTINVYKPKTPEEELISKITEAKTEEIPLPENSWYKPRIWNFYRQYPNVEEILDKNNKATSKTISPNDLQTLSLSGKLSFADGGCANDVCAEKLYQESLRQESSRYYGSANPKSTPFVYVDETKKKKDAMSSKKVGLIDNYNSFPYEEVGRMEARQKMPNKIYRQVFVRPKGQTSETEKTEVFNGLRGWKKTVVTDIYDRQKVLENSVKELSGVDLFELNKSATVWKKDYSSKTLSFLKPVIINSQVNFVLQNNADTKPETIYFDAVTGLITKIETSEMTVFSSKYSSHNGVYLPSEMCFRTIGKDGNAILMKVEQIDWRINESIEDSIFDEPSKN